MAISRQDVTVTSKGCQIECMTSPENTKSRERLFGIKSRFQIIGLLYMAQVVSHVVLMVHLNISQSALTVDTKVTLIK
jgi:hypothetical protein